MDEGRKKLLEKMRGVKQTAQEDLKKENEENKVVQNVMYYGTVQLKRRDGEKEDNYELYTVEVYNYQTDEISQKIYLNGEEVDMGELLRTYEDINPIKDVISKAKEEQEKGEDKETDGEKVESLNELEEENAKDLAGVTGKDEKDVKEVDELDLNQELKTKEQKDEEELDKNTANKLSKKEETKLDQQIKGRTLRNLLGLDEDYVKIAIVSSSQVNQYTNPEHAHTNIDSFVAIKANGEAVVLGDDVLKNDRQEGTNSTDKDLTNNIDGKVNYESNRSSYKIGSTNFYLKVGYDENVGREIKVEDRQPGKSKEGVTYELETSNTWRADDDLRYMQREKSGIYNAENANAKAKEHEEAGCKELEEGELDTRDIDNNPNNNTHEHYTEDSLVPGEDYTFKEWAEEIGENSNVLIERFKREINKKESSTDKAIEDINEDYDRLQGNTTRKL